MYEDAGKRGVPLGGTFELSPLCNMNCKMCYIRISKEEMEKQGKLLTADEWLSLAKEAKSKGMLFLLLTGGEPFLYPDFWKLYESLKQMGFFVSINTNATLLEGETLERLIKNPPYRMNISLYGGSDETYSELCRYEKGYTKVSKAIKALRENNVYVKINGSVTPFNEKDIEKCFDFAKEIESPLQMGAYMFPPARKEDKSTGRFTPQKAGICQARIDKLRYEPEDLTNKLKQINNCKLNGSCTELGDRFRCRAGRSSFWINWKGEMTACGMMDEFKAYPMKDGFEKAWEEVKAKINAQTVLKGCSECEDRDICKVCPAIAFTESGDFNGKPEYLCEMVKAWKEEMLK